MRKPHRVVHVRRRLEMLQVAAVMLARVHGMLHGGSSPGAKPPAPALVPMDRWARPRGQSCRRYSSLAERACSRVRCRPNPGAGCGPKAPGP